MRSQEQLAAWLTITVRCMVTEPQQATVSVVQDEGWVNLEVRVAQVDRGRVIGRSGAAVKSLRVLLEAMASLRGTRFNLSIHDERRPGV